MTANCSSSRLCRSSTTSWPNCGCSTPPHLYVPPGKVHLNGPPWRHLNRPPRNRPPRNRPPRNGRREVLRNVRERMTRVRRRLPLIPLRRQLRLLPLRPPLTTRKGHSLLVRRGRGGPRMFRLNRLFGLNRLFRLKCPPTIELMTCLTHWPWSPTRVSITSWSWRRKSLTSRRSWSSKKKTFLHFRSHFRSQCSRPFSRQFSSPFRH